MKRLLSRGWKPVATMAVLVALVGAPAFAAGLAADSVRSKHIKDGQVKTQDLADLAVTQEKIAFDAVGTNQIGTGVVSSSEIWNGSITAQDLQGFHLHTNTVTVNPGSAATVSVLCSDDETAFSAGGTWDGASTVGPVYIAAINLSGNGGAYNAPSQANVTGRNDGAGARTLTAQVLCLTNIPVS